MALDDGRLKLTWPKVAAQPIFEKVDQQPAQGDAGDRGQLHAQSAHRHAVRPQPHLGASARRLRHGPRPRDAASSTTSARCSTDAPDAAAGAVLARALRVRRLRHSAPARRQSAADDHGARRAGDDPSRQGSRLAFLRDAEIRRAVARRGAGWTRDAEAGRRRVHRAHGRLHLAGDHAAARDGGAARQGGRARLQLHADGAGRRRRPLRLRSAARRPHRRHGRVSGAVARSAGDLRRQVQPDARRRSHGGDQALRLSLLARRARRLRIPVRRLQGRALGRFAATCGATRPASTSTSPRARKASSGASRAACWRSRRPISTCRCRRCAASAAAMPPIACAPSASSAHSSAASCSIPTAACWRARAATTCSTTRKKRTLRVPEPEIHLVRTDDGKILRLTRYRGGNKGPLIFTHGLGVSSLIFSIDTIDTNMLEYLVAAEYDCWLLDYRASVDLPYAHELWNADDVALKDYPAAFAKVRAVHALIDRAGHRPLLRRHDLHHVAARRPRRRALGRHLADLDRLRGAVVPAASARLSACAAVVRGDGHRRRQRPRHDRRSAARARCSTRFCR